MQNKIANTRLAAVTAWLTVWLRTPKRRSVLLFLSLLHLLSQAERPHVGPDFFDIGQAFRLRSALAHVVPAQRVFTIRGPDRVLLLVINYYLINRSVFALVLNHR